MVAQQGHANGLPYFTLDLIDGVPLSDDVAFFLAKNIVYDLKWVRVLLLVLLLLLVVTLALRREGNDAVISLSDDGNFNDLVALLAIGAKARAIRPLRC